MSQKRIEELLIKLEEFYGRVPDPIIDPLMLSKHYSFSIIQTDWLKKMVFDGLVDGILNQEEYIFLKGLYSL